MTTIGTRSASKAFGEKLSARYAKNANTTSGFISAVTNDSTGRPKTAIVQIAGGTSISVAIPYGSNVYPGISVSLVNDGSASLASWRIANSSSASPVLVGGQIVNQNGSIIANFDSIWVKDRGYIMAGGFEDILGNPTGPRVMLNEYGLFGYAIPFPEPVVSIATIESDDLHVGDVLIGYQRPSHANLLVSPEQGLIQFSVDSAPFLTINGGTGNRLEDYLWIGPSSGPQVGMGNMLGVAEFAMRDIGNRYVFLVRSDPMRVQIGATVDSEGIVWDDGRLTVRGAVYATSGTFSGEIAAASGTIGGWTINPTNLASADGSTVLKSVGGIVLDAQVARFDSATLKWMQGTTEYLRMGTFVDLGSVTGSVIESKVVDLTVTSDGSIYLVPGAGGTVMLGGTSYGESGSNYTEVAKDGSVVQRGSATFTATNGVIGPTWKPISNSTTALQVQNALGTATVLNADTTNARIGIGTTEPATPLHVNLENATTAVVDPVLTISKSSTDTPAAYFGSGIEFNLKSTTTANRPASTINTLWADPTNGAEIAVVTLNTVYGGSLTNVAKFGGTLGTVLNEDGNAWNDLRVEGDTDTHLIFADASADKVGISESAPNATLDVNGTTRLGDSDTNYSAFDATGHLTFNGTAKPWNDMLIEPSARTTGANAPTFEKWYDDAAGTSRGVYLYSFDDANAGSEKEVFFTLQMSHAWDGGDIQFHVHWIGAVADTTATPRWGLEYVFKEPGAVFGDSTTIYAIGNHLSEADITVHKHYITAFTAISPGSTANDLSSVLIGRLFRDSANAADTYNATGAKCGLLYIDAHYQIARIGSTDEYSA